MKVGNNLKGVGKYSHNILVRGKSQDMSSVVSMEFFGTPTKHKVHHNIKPTTSPLASKTIENIVIMKSSMETQVVRATSIYERNVIRGSLRICLHSCMKVTPSQVKSDSSILLRHYCQLSLHFMDSIILILYRERDEKDLQSLSIKKET